ncbi:MAG: nitrous oxide reductase accessory protein NosL [Sandaracinaceae bacterium]|nr:nitrous oxide reductase accessory protein NosL [Sandaracinaceae bacterium]MDW8245728.1 nitrous oxide reductase accessory protein NosL [Sandaracinaceae bacterium]
MFLLSRRWLEVLAFLFFGLAACEKAKEESQAQAPSDRCALCGMRVRRGAAFSAGAKTKDGKEVLFDSIKCMFRWLASHPEASDPWVTEHLSRKPLPAQKAWYVLGSSLQGPMGADLVPLATHEDAERIRTRHGGTQVLAFSEVKKEIIDELFRH